MEIMTVPDGIGKIHLKAADELLMEGDTKNKPEQILLNVPKYLINKSKSKTLYNIVTHRRVNKLFAILLQSISFLQ